MKLSKSLQKLRESRCLTLVALGDSLTSGWMEPKGYVDYIEQWLKETYPDAHIKVLNRGVPGDTAGGGLLRIQQDVLNFQPDLVFVQFGLNDAFMGVPEPSFFKSINLIIEQISSLESTEILVVASVYILLDPSMNEVAERYYGILRQCAADHGLAYVPVHEYWKKNVAAGVDYNVLVQADGVHPTAVGYRLMAEAIWEHFK